LDTAPSARRGRARSVRTYLWASVLCAVATVGALEIVVATTTSHRAIDSSRRAAAFQANLAASELTQALQQGESVLTGLASLDIRAVAANPSACTLTFSGVGPFTAGHIDVVLPNGVVPCSSLANQGAPAGATQAGATWLAPISKAPAVSGLFTDRLTNTTAIAVSVPVENPTGELTGLVAVVLPIAEVAPGLTQLYGGPQRFTFAITDGDGRAVLSASSPTSTAQGRPNEPPMPVTGSHRGWIEARQAVAGLGWQVVAGQRTADALASTRQLLFEEVGVGAIALLVLLALLGLVNRQIGRPLRQLTQSVAQAADEDSPLPVVASGPIEVRKLAEQFNQTVAARASFANQLSDDADRFRQLAWHDALTGLPNRALLLQRIKHAARRGRRSHTQAAVLFVDLDRFKRVNDTYGHEVGDELLVAVAQRLSALVRTGDTLARFAGDEFVFLCEDMESAADAELLASRIDAAFAQPFVLTGVELEMTASVGLAFAGPGGEVSTLLVANADVAMYQAKRKGGAGHQIIDVRAAAEMIERNSLESDLRAALARDDLSVAYQPIVDVADGVIRGVEALLRWESSDRGAVSAHYMIEAAEQTGLIIKIGAWVLERACRDHASWSAAYPDMPLELAVNVSARQLMSGDFAATVSNILSSTHMRPASLILEVTESILIDDSEGAMIALAGLKSLGVQLALDDFGTGFSSLSYLRRLPIDIVKIDRTFIANLKPPFHATITAAVTNLAHILGLSVTAEGVETADQRAAIKAIGCECAQGYLYARPMPSSGIAKYIGRVKSVSTA
jgi:diguanylate cyclase (GGDEF)-like protein